MHENKKKAMQMSMVVLAGGRSSRMGTDKSDLLLCGSTFLEYQIRKGRQLGITDILVSGYAKGSCSVPVIKDREAGKGPLGGLEACFRQAVYDQVLVLGVDVPLVPVSELEGLADRRRVSDKRVTILQHGGKEEPLIGIYSKDLADDMLEEITLRKGSVFAFLRRTGYDVYESKMPHEYFANINCPEDYEKYIKCGCEK